MCEARFPINGGRVEMGTPGTNYKDSIIGDIKDPLATISKTITPTPLVRAFFSKENMNWIQASLKRRIYELSKQKFLIGKQSETELIVVMRSVYCMFSRNLCDCDVHEQVRQLDGEVLAMLVPDVYNRIVSYLGYRRDAGRVSEEEPGSDLKKESPTFLDRGVSTSGAGRKVLTYPVF